MVTFGRSLTTLPKLVKVDWARVALARAAAGESKFLVFGDMFCGVCLWSSCMGFEHIYSWKSWL